MAAKQKRNDDEGSRRELDRDDETEVTVVETKVAKRLPDVSLKTMSKHFTQNPNILEILPKDDEFWLNLLKKEGYNVDEDFKVILNKWKDPLGSTMRDYLIKEFSDTRYQHFLLDDFPLHKSIVLIHGEFKKVLQNPTLDPLSRKTMEESHKTMEDIFLRAREREKARRRLFFTSEIVRRTNDRRLIGLFIEDNSQVTGIKTYDQLIAKLSLFNRVCIIPNINNDSRPLHMRGFSNNILKTDSERCHADISVEKDEIEYKLKILEHYLREGDVFRIFDRNEDDNQKKIFIVHKSATTIELFKPVKFEHYNFLPPVFEAYVGQAPSNNIGVEGIWDGFSVTVNGKVRWFLANRYNLDEKLIEHLKFPNGLVVKVKEYHENKVLALESPKK